MNAVEELKNKRIVHWFRKDQRVSDHEIFSRLNEFEKVSAFYVLERRYDDNHSLGFPWVSNKRKAFLNESLIELAAKLDVLGVDFHVFKTHQEL
ncbi:MAG: deoxyribodipyrimidine photolyase, partial [Bacteroidia bacterium]